LQQKTGVAGNGFEAQILCFSEFYDIFYKVVLKQHIYDVSVNILCREDDEEMLNKMEH